MTDAIRAAYSSFKHVPTRSVLQLVLEVPIEQAEAALDLLGIPQPGAQTWCAIARLNDSAAELPAGAPPEQQHGGAADRQALTPGERLVQQAGILCSDERFQKWAASYYGDALGYAYTTGEVAAWLREECGIASRRELATNKDAAAKFNELVARYKSETGQSTWERPV